MKQTNMSGRGRTVGEKKEKRYKSKAKTGVMVIFRKDSQSIRNKGSLKGSESI